jgi:D-3-phosphoglycerate dehydrogenase
MLNRNSVIAVTSRSFSANAELRNKLSSYFPNARFNETGKVLSDENLVDFLTGAEAGIFALEKIDSSVLSQLPKLKILSKFGVGVDGVDFEALESFNVTLLHFPGTNRNAVAEIALSNAISLLHRIPENQKHFSNGDWVQLKGREIHGKAVGVVGAGPIGKRFLELCSFFECELRAFDLQHDKAFNKKFGVKESSLDEILSLSDVISVHLPLTSKTRGIIGANEINLIKSTSVIINLSRGGILDESALIGAHAKGLIAGFALDVFDTEPCDLTPFAGLLNVILTPHIGGSTVEAIANMGNAAIMGLTNLLN